MSQPVHITVAPNVYVDAEAVRAAVTAALPPADSGARKWPCRYRHIDTVTVGREGKHVTVEVEVHSGADEHVYLSPERAREMAGALLALAAESEQQ